MGMCFALIALGCLFLFKIFVICPVKFASIPYFYMIFEKLFINASVFAGPLAEENKLSRLKQADAGIFQRQRGNRD
jgi:hypothetical protein